MSNGYESPGHPVADLRLGAGLSAAARAQTYAATHGASSSTLCTLLAVLFAAVLMIAPHNAYAQASASFFNQVGAATDRTAADACASTFSSELTGQGLVERPSPEIETMMRECVEDLSNPDYARQCDLRAAEGQVDYIVIYEVSRAGEEWYFHIEALSPIQQGTVWQQGTLVAESNPVRGAMSGCGELAQDFLVRQSFVDTDDGRGGAQDDELPAVVEVVSVTPTPVAMYVDGAEVGVAPGQFDVPAGQPVEVRLQSPGFAPWTQTVQVDAGDLLSLPPIRLSPLPGTIEVTANVQGGSVLVDGASVATTVRNRAVPVEVSSGAHTIEVRREGYVSFRNNVRVAPGGVVTVTAELTPVAAPVVNPAPVARPYSEDPDTLVSRPAEPDNRPTCTGRRVSGALLTGLSIGLAGYGVYLNGAARVTLSPGEPWEEEEVIAGRRAGGIGLMVGGAGLGTLGVWQAARACR